MVLQALRNQFRPEFLNRIDETIIYKSLGESQIAGIVRVQLKTVEERLRQKKIGIEFADAAIHWVAQKGFDPLYGARPLKRVIQTELLNPLSKDLISGHYKVGDRLRVQVEENKLVLEKLPS
jgi:ATP-dependent Clp protease ATP-binding subunit ClpB